MHSFCSLNRRGALVVLFGFTTSSAQTAQITIVGNQVIGVFWGQDYHDAENIRFSKNGAQLDFTMDGAKATFVRNPIRGRITVHEANGRVISIDLKKD